MLESTWRTNRNLTVKQELTRFVLSNAYKDASIYENYFSTTKNQSDLPDIFPEINEYHAFYGVWIQNFKILKLKKAVKTIFGTETFRTLFLWTEIRTVIMYSNK